MRIDEIAVDGFGLLRDRRLAPAPGLTLIRGANEAGKSTLLAFVRSILFGFETKSHPALAGGRRGGWLTIRTGDDRTVRIERYGQTGGNGQLRLLDEEGDDLGADLLPRILQGVERNVYNNVFAFGLAELAQISNLSTADIAARIYGAGMGTGATSVVEIENRLEKARSELFAKQGRNPQMNVLLAEIDALNAQIDGLDPPAIFRAAGDRRELLQAELTGLSVEVEAIAIERHRLERLRDGWPSWVALGAARTALAELLPAPVDADAIPGDILERLALAERDLEAATNRAAELGREQVRAAGELDGVVVEAALLAGRHEAETLLAALPEARADRTRLVELEHDRIDRATALADALRRLGPDWDEARLLTVDDSLAAQGAIGGPFRVSLEAAERDLEASRAQVAAVELNLADARADLAAIDPALPVSPATPGEPMGRPGPADRPIARAAPLSPTRLGAGLVLAAAGFGGALLFGLTLAQAAFVGLLLGAATAIAGSVASRSQERPPAGPVQGSDPLATRRDERLGRVRLFEERARTAGQREQAAGQALERAQGEWATWLSAHGLPAGLDRATAARMLDSATAARASLAALHGIEGRQDAIGTRLTSFESRATAFLAGLGRVADDPLAGLDAVRRDLANTLDAAGTQQRASQDLERVEATLAATGASHQEAAARLATILAEGHSADAASLRGAIAEANRRTDVAREIQAARGTLVALSGPADALVAFETDLATIADISDVEAGLASVVERNRELEARRAATLEQLGAEGRAITEIENSAAAAELRQQRAERLTEMAVLAESWSVITIALGLLRRTRSRYEREHRPDVLKEAETLLAAWTDGRYIRIHAPLGKQIQELERRDGVHVPLAGLSTGTAEQLYLAMRFGLVEHFGREAESLPLVMDDILVNFDPLRAERAARSIEDLATRHQVLYFTCHPGTPLAPAATIELPDLSSG